MPYSFTQIEKDKSNIIGFVFFFLIVFYLFIITGFFFLTKSCWIALASNGKFIWATVTFADGISIVLVGVCAAFIHYMCSTSHLTLRVMRWLGAKSLDLNNPKHQLFQNIIEEVAVATGNQSFQGCVIPSTALNSFSLDDEEHTPVIGITDGALFALTRPQLEAIVAHHAGSILEGDTFTATIVGSMFEFYTLAINSKISSDDDSSHTIHGSFRFSRFIDMGQGAIIIIFFMACIYAFYVITAFIAACMRMLISRQSKLRADAIAVRLTRNPLSLAQALRVLSSNWRGVGCSWEAMEGIFIINPTATWIDEQKGITSDLFSTHPPIRERINSLIDMAHLNEEQFGETIQVQLGKVQEVINVGSIDEASLSSKRWTFQHDNAWYGPFTLREAGMVVWLTPQTIVKKWGDSQEYLLKDDTDLKQLKLNLIKDGGFSCPVCRIALYQQQYENEEVFGCVQCKGVLINEDQAGVIMFRRHMMMSEEVRNIAKQSLVQLNQPTVSRIGEITTQNGFTCPKCMKNHMQTRPFTLFYPVIIDKCQACGLMWFEEQELEVLQAMYEIKNPQPKL